MTIKEIEELSGMTRANIRFYEQEHLLRPERGENGYRNYSENDLATLKRIQLLRSLGVSLDDIRALQSGELMLSSTLEERIAALEREKQSAGYAQDVCRAIRSDGASYDTLDAQKYLNGIPHADAGARYFSTESDTMPWVKSPWRRYFARSLDMAIYDLAWNVFLALVFHMNVLNRGTGAKILDVIIVMVITLLVEPLLLRLFGTTLGKWIFGLRLENRFGERPSYGEGLVRTAVVLSSGLGLSIPILNLVRLYKSYKACQNGEYLPWEDELTYTLKDTRLHRGFVFVAAYVALVLVSAYLISLPQLPPNRGDITVAEFAENYNYLCDYYNINYMYELNEDGNWVEKPIQGNVITIGGNNEAPPEFEFETENDIITSINYKVLITNEFGLGLELAKIHSYPYNEIQLSSLSWAGAQKGAGILSKTRYKLIKGLPNDAYEFEYTVGDIELSCKISDISISFYMDKVE